MSLHVFLAYSLMKFNEYKRSKATTLFEMSCSKWWMCHVCRALYTLQFTQWTLNSERCNASDNMKFYRKSQEMFVWIIYTYPKHGIVYIHNTRAQAQHEQIINNTQCIYVLIADLTVGCLVPFKCWTYFVIRLHLTRILPQQYKWCTRYGRVCRRRK